MARPALLVRTGRIPYRDAWDAQLRLAALRRAGAVPDVVWLLEHPPVYTYGRHGTRTDLHVGDEALASLGGELVASDRGGQMTWHGPGQTTGYVIADLRPTGVRRFVAALAGAMADASRLPGAATADGEVGVFVEGRKLGSVGIRVARGVSTHGLALNRDPDLAWFGRITACGAPGVPATSIAAEGGDPGRARVEADLAAALADRLGWALAPALLAEVLPRTAA